MRGLGWRHRSFGVAGMTLLACSVGAPGAGAASVRPHVSSSLTPIVECSAAHGPATRTLFGYRNTGPAVTVSVGPDNGFSPGAVNRGQPTTFQTGTQINVFSVDVTGKLTWTLAGSRVQAPGPSCQETPAGSSLAGWGPIAAIVIVTAVLGTLLFWRTRRLRTATR